jgi:hypothetical protein
MANFQCLECNICFAIPHQHHGHRRLVHQSTYEIRIATGRIIDSQSIDGTYPCPVGCYKNSFDYSDNLWRHFKGQHAEQNNLALNRNLDDNLQKAMSVGMLIQSPIKQTPELLRDVGLVVFNIVDGIRLLMCKVCNVCLKPEPSRVRNHLLGHDNRKAPKRHYNGGSHRVATIAPDINFTSSFDEIQFTRLQDPRLERYIASPRQEFLPVVPGITVVNGY